MKEAVIMKKTTRAIISYIMAVAIVLGCITCTQLGQIDVEAKEGKWVVTLDPGHGGSDGGATRGGINEKDLNLKIAKYCKEYIENNTTNIVVRMTRENDKYVGLYDRAPLARSYGSDLLVSIHNNSSTNTSTHGSEVIIPRHFYNAEMKVFGEDVLNNITASTGIAKRKVYTRDCTNGVIYTLDEVGAPNGQLNPENDMYNYSQYTGEKSPRVLGDYYGIICSGVELQLPTCIIEHAFLSNDGDRAKLADERILKALGEADAKAIIKYFETGVKQNEAYEEARQLLLPEIDTNEIGIAYKAHVQKEGWQDWKYNGEEAGTTGKSYRVEAIMLYPYNLPEGASLKTETHIQGYGWRTKVINSYEKAGTIGTSGESKRIEAIALTLEGVPGYEIEYRVHIQNIGWSSWRSQGEIAGTSGMSYRLESIQIRIVPVEQKTLSPYLTYRSHVQKKGWLDWVSEGSLSGTSGKSLRMEAVQINLHNPEPGMYISAKIHVQKKGWLTFPKVTPETIIGTSGESLRVEAINLMLNGTDKYKLQYRVHIQGIGWTGWIDQGNDAGTVGLSKRLEAMQIRIVEK